MKPTTGQVLLALGVTVAIVAVIAGIVVAGTPAEGRARRLDDVRARDLRAIMTSIDSFWGRQERLPESLSELVADPRADVSILDPGTEREYRYRSVDEDSYELCATFELASIPNNRAPGAFWLHDAGENCFEMEASAPEPLSLPRGEG